MLSSGAGAQPNRACAFEEKSSHGVSEESLLTLAKRLHVAPKLIRRWWVEAYGEAVTLSRIQRVRYGYDDAELDKKREQALTAFDTDEGLEVLRERLGVRGRVIG
jgi:hypothetical protein